MVGAVLPVLCLAWVLEQQVQYSKKIVGTAQAGSSGASGERNVKRRTGPKPAQEVIQVLSSYFSLVVSFVECWSM